MTLQQRVLVYLHSIAPERATNSDIRHNLGVRHHPQIYQATQELLNAQAILGRRIANDWEFWVETHVAQLTTPAAPSAPASPASSALPTPAAVPVATDMDSSRFERLAQTVMSRHYGVPLHKGTVPGVRKQFDLVSADGQTVGDAKYYAMVGGERLPPAKFSIIAEHVWLLEKTGARRCFLVFGNDVRVPQQWLARYGNLVDGVDFYFLTSDGELCSLDQAGNQQNP